MIMYGQSEYWMTEMFFMVHPLDKPDLDLSLFWCETQAFGPLYGFDVTAVSVVIEAIVCVLSCTQLVA